jgi:general secretion pathway protein E
VGIYELLAVDEELRSLILKKAPAGELRHCATAKGMVTLREDGWAKACAGITTIDEILRVTQEES